MLAACAWVVAALSVRWGRGWGRDDGRPACLTVRVLPSGLLGRPGRDARHLPWTHPYHQDQVLRCAAHHQGARLCGLRVSGAGGPGSAWLQLSPVTEGRGSPQLPCPHAACFIFVLPFLSCCLLEPLLPKSLSFLHPWPTLFMGPSLYLVEYSQDVPILKKITSLTLPDISRSCQPLFLHSPENCLSCVSFYNSFHPNLCSLVSATSLKGSSGPLQ